MKKIFISKDYVKEILPPRDIKAHKGNFGHALIIAGSYEMPGAGILCSKACLYSGAGLVTLATGENLVDRVIQVLPPEIMFLRLPVDSKGRLLIRKAWGKIKNYIIRRKIDTIGIGPGLSNSPNTKKLVRYILKNVKVPMVVDADAINVLEGNPELLKKTEMRIIITPHPGELARLTGSSVEQIQSNREKFAFDFARNYNLVCVLKGHETVVSDGKEVFVNTTGNPGMATAGSGDVLTGMITAFIKQTRTIINAAITGVYLHGLAGDISAKEKTQITMTAGDIIENLTKAIKKVWKK